MKLKTITIQVNDDDTYQVECRGDDYCCIKSYSASNLKDVTSKIEQAQKDMASMKDKKKKTGKIEAFMNTSDESDDSEDNDD
jgi:hypothetical protein